MFNPFSVISSKIFATTTVVFLALSAVQTVRIEGFWFIKGYEQQLRDANKRIDALLLASEVNAKAQQKVNDDRTKSETQLARSTDEKAIIAKVLIRDVSKRYAADNSLHKVCPDLGGANPPAEVDPAKGNDGMPETSIVVSAGDFELLNNLAGFGIKAGNWARDMVKNDLAVEAE